MPPSRLLAASALVNVDMVALGGGGGQQRWGGRVLLGSPPASELVAIFGGGGGGSCQAPSLVTLPRRKNDATCNCRRGDFGHVPPEASAGLPESEPMNTGRDGTPSSEEEEAR